MTEFPYYSNAEGNASDKGKGNREYRQDLRWYARCGEPTQERDEKLESRVLRKPARTVRRGEVKKGWLRYHQKEYFWQVKAYKQHLAGPLPYFLQVTDLFFRPLAGLLPHRAQDTKSDPCRRDTIAD